MFYVFLLVVGFALLVIGANIFVDSSVGIAKKLRVPSVIIGLTIVAMGTSAPEAVVSITASVSGNNDLSIGNVVGSNIFNLLLIVGLCGLLKPFVVNFKEISKDFWVSIGAAALLLIFMISSGNEISRIASGILLVLFAAYMVVLIRQAMRDKNKIAEEPQPLENAAKIKPLPLNILLSVFGCGIIVGGGQLTVNGAVAIAESLGVSERIIGLTIVAVGTSLPELVTSLVACKKGENSIALGNVVGSNIFNILCILGISGLISPLAIDGDLIIDIIILIAISLVTLLFAFTGKRLVRLEGLAMVLLYTAYVTMLILV